MTRCGFCESPARAMYRGTSLVSKRGTPFCGWHLILFYLGSDYVSDHRA